MKHEEMQALQAFLQENQTDETLPMDKQGESVEKMFDKLPLAPDIKFTEVVANGIPALWSDAPNAAADRVILYLHGGGYVFGNPRTHRVITGELGRAAESRTLAIDYRLAPKHLFPAPVDDALSAYKWLLEQGFNPKSIAVAGDSAGGGLTVALLVAIRDAGLALPAGAALLSPWTDLEVTGQSAITQAAKDPVLTRQGLLDMANMYLGQASPRSPLASPIYADLKGLPPLLIQVGEIEMLLDDAFRLASHAAVAGVKVRLETWPDMFHVWHQFAPLLSDGRKALADAGNFINDLFTND